MKSLIMSAMIMAIAGCAYASDFGRQLSVAAEDVKAAAAENKDAPAAGRDAYAQTSEVILIPAANVPSNSTSKVGAAIIKKLEADRSIKVLVVHVKTGEGIYPGLYSYQAVVLKTSDGVSALAKMQGLYNADIDLLIHDTPAFPL